MKSKKLTLILSLVILTVFLLSACAPAATPVVVATSAPVIESAPTVEAAATAAQDASASASVALSATYANAVSIEQQLILGTFKLAGTDLAVSEEQASILVPLYTNLKTIVESTMPAQGTQSDPASAQPQAVSAETRAQIDTIIKNILAAMTPEQVKAISDMQVTREIAQTIMTENGISMVGPGGQGGTMPGANGQPPVGTPPAGGQNGSAGAPPSNGQNGQQPGGGIIPPELVTALIKLLQTR